MMPSVRWDAQLTVELRVEIATANESTQLGAICNKTAAFVCKEQLHRNAVHLPQTFILLYLEDPLLDPTLKDGNLEGRIVPVLCDFFHGQNVFGGGRRRYVATACVTHLCRGVGSS